MNCRILAVEDSATQAEALRAVLEAHGHEVSVARTAEAALQQIAENEFDLVLSDVVMPGMSGYDLCRTIKQGPVGDRLPVVLLTSLNDPMDIVRGLECGADNYITKPYDPEHLVARLRHVLDNRQLRRHSKTSMGVTVSFLGRNLTITSDREQILDLFISSVEDVVRTNEALQHSQRELAEVHSRLEDFAREKAREARLSTERYRALLQNAGDAIFVLDLQGRILEVNSRVSDLLGRPSEQLLQSSLFDLVAEDERAFFRERLTSLGEEGQIPQAERRFVDAEGKEIYCEVTTSLTPLEDESLVLLIARDATERKQAEMALREQEAAERANQAKSEFLSRMSHELRTPLNAILGFAQLLEMDNLPPEQSESVEQILRAGRHLLGLINEVLDLSRIEAGKLPLSLEPVSVDGVLRDAVRLVQPLAAQRAIKLELETTDAADRFVTADLQRLKQVVLNFISNAVKYNRAGGTVRMFVTEVDDRLRIAVQDTGPGIPPERLGRLFVPFERLGADESGVEGTGLGLVLARGLAEAMHGEIGVESTVGEGSTFWVELPRAEPPPPAPAPFSVGGFRSGVGVEGEIDRTVLYIEDNPSNLRLVERLLARSGVRLITAMQGRLGLELARDHRPDLILLDLNLPDLSGEEVLGHIRADPELEQTPVVVVSADALPKQVERLLQAGAREYLTKPFRVQQFLDVVGEALELERQ